MGGRMGCFNAETLIYISKKKKKELPFTKSACELMHVCIET